MQKMTKVADRLICIYEGQPRRRYQGTPRKHGRYTHEVAQEEAAGKANRVRSGDQCQGHGAGDGQEILAEVFHARPGEVEEMI